MQIEIISDMPFTLIVREAIAILKGGTIKVSDVPFDSVTTAVYSFTVNSAPFPNISFDKGKPCPIIVLTSPPLLSTNSNKCLSVISTGYSHWMLVWIPPHPPAALMSRPVQSTKKYVSAAMIVEMLHTFALPASLMQLESPN